MLPAGTTRTRINPSSPTCNGPATVYAPNSLSGPLACAYDYMQNTEIYPEASKVGFIGRATLQVNSDLQVFAELVQSQADSKYVLSPNPQRVRNLSTSLLPAKYRNVLGSTGTFSGIRYRMEEAGNRTNEVTSTAQRIVFGASGSAAGWDYDLGISRAENRAVDKYIDGYVLFDKFEAGIKAGTINPFGPSSQAGIDLLNSIKVNDEARKSKGVSTAIDGKMSKALATLDGGDLALAVGAEVRRENTTFTPSALLISNNIAGDRGTGSDRLKATDDGRTVSSAFAEMSAPFSKEVELQLALRHDRYSEVGSTTNPKIGVRWQPQKSVMLRASAGTGFRAPSLSDLKRPVTYGSASSFLTDAQCVKSGLDTIDNCTDQYPVERRSNANLKPEKSRQFSIGAVLEVGKEVTLGADLWHIRKDDVISTLGEQIIVESPGRYNGKYITRDADGYITSILLQKENQGRLTTEGVDISADYRGPQSPLGRFSANLSGTVVLKYDRQFGPLEQDRSNLGVFLNDQVVQKWRHRISFGWDLAPFSVTLANQYSSSYNDQNTAYDPGTNKFLAPRRVDAYSLWDMTGSWTISKSLKLRAGVLNLADKAPPFSNQAYYFLAGYDPTYTDPRGRSGFVSLNYAFK